MYSTDVYRAATWRTDLNYSSGRYMYDHDSSYDRTIVEEKIMCIERSAIIHRANGYGIFARTEYNDYR